MPKFQYKADKVVSLLTDEAMNQYRCRVYTLNISGDRLEVAIGLGKTKDDAKERAALIALALNKLIIEDGD